MARDLDININVVDGGAKQTLDDVDRSLDATAAGAERTGQSVALLEGKLALAKAQLANTNTEMRMLTAAMADMSGGAQAKLQSELQMTGERVIQARQNVAGLTQQLRENTAATNAGTESMSNMDRMAERLVMRMALLMAIRGAFQFTEGLFTAAQKTADLATNLDTSITKVQEWEFAAKQSGISMGALSGAADTLGKKIAGGSDSVTVALQQLGLDTDQYFSAEPGERFDQTAAAIAQMGDKTARTGVEMALFGTDKIDPLVLRLRDLEKAAHDAGVVLDEEDTKKLDQAAKSMETTTTRLKVMAAGWLVAAQNATAYYLAAGNSKSARSGAAAVAAGLETGFDPKTGRTVAMDTLSQEEQDKQRQATIDAQMTSMLGGASRPTNPFAAGMSGPTGPMDPSKKAGLQAIASVEKEITTEVESQMSAEKAQLALEKSMFGERQQLYKKIQEEMKKTSEMYLKVTNDAVVAELAAKERVNAAIGLDIHGNPIALGQTPQAVAAKAQHELDVSAATSPGVSTAARQQEINDTFLKAVMADAKAADAESAARGSATAAAVTLSSAHMGAVQAVDATSQALASFRGVLVGTPDDRSAAAMARNAPLVVGAAGVYDGGGVGMAMGPGGAGIAGPQFTATGRAAGLGNLPHFGDGGYAASPMHAVVGDAPGGEYMIPAQKMDKLLAGGGGGVGAIHVTINGNVDSELRARQLADQVAKNVLRTLKTQNSRI